MSDQKDVAGLRSGHVARRQISNWRTRKLATAVAALVLVLGVADLSACSNANHPSAVSPSNGVSRAQAYAAAISEVRDYLTVWRERGDSVAAREFLVPSERRGGVTVILRSGKVISYQPYRWMSGNHFTLWVIMDLHFEGSPAAWDVGRNGRFVTFSRTTAQSRYLLEFGTGP